MYDDPPNEIDHLKLINHFETLAQYYDELKQPFKSSPFSTVAKRLKSEIEKGIIIKETYDLTQYQGIGNSSQIEFNEFVKTGTSTRLEELATLVNSTSESYLDTLIKEFPNFEDELKLWFAIYTIQNKEELKRNFPKCEFSANLSAKLSSKLKLN